ncbi:CRISPR-associated protein Cas5, Hmari subtype [Methanococcus vannielii SB]|jgi:CRISPR-associated protein Cas5h|uniref:CRISPR-associated protein Cas5, Hmari subtype n=1 Tax=Methanococcus vannielii (strain ATCC 35089 / DSM 1224 / JCM 13029 / OCM 148 / SB) TaxID=406327 RepID=A6UNR9_METVS|nr:type I-B CRISPR-associated protein Cas5b [Methanococcus vannielii]ABR54141.1 CRISPR-associated protein Cas5, Hmari subtype [Methanococcus vannielii SB]
MKSVVFSAKSEYGRFRKPYTTTSALTFLCIHPVAAKGLIGALVGIDKLDLYEETKDLKIGIEVLGEINKDLQSVKLLNLKEGVSGGMFHFPSNIEFLRCPHYRFYVMWNENKLNELNDKLNVGEWEFTPYLGVSESIAKMNYEGMFEVSKVEKADFVNTIIPTKNILPKINLNTKMYSDKIPVKNNSNREYIEYEKIVFAEKNPLFGKISNTDIYQVGERNVYFF